MTTSYINSRDINHYVIYICSVHLAPPPCFLHLWVLPIAIDLQSGSIHRRILRAFIITEFSCDIFYFILFYKLKIIYSIFFIIFAKMHTFGADQICIIFFCL
jgi:hypothetical protein